MCFRFNRWALLAAIASVVLAMGCEAFRYDEPPVADIVELSKPRTLMDAVELTFSEPVFAPSLGIGLWPRELDPEGDLAEGLEPIVSEASCRFEGTSRDIDCGPIALRLHDDHMGVTLTLDVDFFEPYAGVPLMVRVDAGLESAVEARLGEASGDNVARTPQDFQLMFFDQCQMGQPVGDIGLNSNVVLVTADVGDLVEAFPGIYLRIYVDFVVDPETGRFTAVGTAGDLWPDIKKSNPTSSAIEDHFAMLSGRGWMVFVHGELCEAEPGRYYLKTIPMDASATIAGYVPTTLTDFQLVGYLEPHSVDEPNGAPGTRDLFEGTLLTSGGNVLEGAIELDALSAQFQGEGLYMSERTELGQVCSVQQGEPRCVDVSDECVADCGAGKACVGGDCVDVSSECEPSCRRTFIEQMPATCDPDPCEVMIPKGGECLPPEDWSPPQQCCTPSSTLTPPAWCEANDGA